jgi:hypothetical protein
MATEGGIVAAELLLESGTVPPLLFESITVQVVEELAVSVVPEQLTAVTISAVVKATDAVCEEPFKAAVMAAL